MADARGRAGGRLPTLPALDGIRAVAVAAVLLYHSDIFWFPGGLLGVEVFFVLSGYLITSLLWSEVGWTGGISVIEFYRRRARRLLPAVGVMIVVVSAAWVAWLPGEVAATRGDVVAAATYTSNWYLIHADHSYFFNFLRPSPFAHLWSLAIEEQFYLVWPPVMLFLWKKVRSPKRAAALILGGAGLSVVALTLLYRQGDPSRIYYGTDTRASALMIGAALALVWRPFAIESPKPRVAPWILDAATVASAGFLVFSFMRFDDTSPVTYRPGLLLVSLATAGLIAAVVHPDARLGRALAATPLRWLGKRSYSVYLWYFPVFAVTRPGVDLDMSIGSAFALRVAATLTLATLSYRYVEQPIRNGALGRWIRAVRERARAPGRAGQRFDLGLRLSVLSTVTMLAILSVAMADARPPIAAASSASAPVRHVEDSAEPVPFEPSKGPFLAIGDSVMVGAKPELRDRFRRITVNARVGRQVKEGIALLEQLRASGRLGNVVVIHLGNNGRFSSAQFDRIMRAVAGVPKVVFVNVKVPRRWEASVNRVLVAGVRRHPGAVLVNWRRNWRACGGRIFGSDATHLTAVGARCYARTIAAAI